MDLLSEQKKSRTNDAVYEDWKEYIELRRKFKEG